MPVLSHTSYLHVNMPLYAYQHEVVLYKKKKREY